MKILTVFTPTYNRANLISRGYEALCRQSCHDFKWLIIDDGSNDNTKALVMSWLLKDARYQEVAGGFIGYAVDAPWLEIRYCYKDNGGLHTGYNKAAELMDTEICVCIDSDDYMPDDAVEIITKKWVKYNDGNISGLIGLDYLVNGTRLGCEFSEGTQIHCIELCQDKRYQFDKKIVIRVDLFKKEAPQPTYNGERNFNPMYMILKVDQHAPFVLINDNLCFVDYQATGMAANIFKQYVNSANSFCALRCLYMSLNYTSFAFRMKHLLHLSSSVILAGDFKWLRKCRYPIAGYMLLPFGFLLSRYILYKSKK